MHFFPLRALVFLLCVCLCVCVIVTVFAGKLAAVVLYAPCSVELLIEMGVAFRGSSVHVCKKNTKSLPVNAI